jgi:hypothetical protein
MMYLLVVALCIYPNSFRFISDSPFEGEWKAAALCAVVLTVEFSVLLFSYHASPSLIGRGFLSLVAGTALVEIGLALFAGWHATMGLPCFGVPGLYSSAEDVQRADAAYQTLAVVDALALLGCVATVALVIVGAVRLAWRRRS